MITDQQVAEGGEGGQGESRSGEAEGVARRCGALVPGGG